MNPEISVIMPVYNGERYIREAVESVLHQTFSDWELIIVNDSSTDGTEKILESFSDPRIKVLKNNRNLGSVGSRNKAFLVARGEFIAILDADDIAMPARFEEQVKFLRFHPDVGLVASLVKIIGEDGVQIGRVMKDITPPEKAPMKILFHNFLAFSSVMMRKDAMPEIPFDENAVPVEDVALYLKILPHSKFATLPKVLTSYRSHDKGISKVFGTKRQAVMDRLITSELNKLDIHPSLEELKIHRTNFGYGGKDIENFLRTREAWLGKLVEQNKKTGRFPRAVFEEVVTEKWLESCDANVRLGFATWKLFWHSPLSRQVTWRHYGKKLLRLGVKCLLSKDKT